MADSAQGFGQGIDVARVADEVSKAASIDDRPQGPPTIASYEPAYEGGEPMMQFFQFTHLPTPLQDVSRQFYALAVRIVMDIPRNPERTAALRKLLESKDCAVRARLYK